MTDGITCLPTEAPQVLSAANMDGGPLPLGFSNQMMYYYLSPLTGLVECLSANQHTEKSLIAMAPLDWYRKWFPANNGKNIDWQYCCESLFALQAQAGYYNSDRVKGRGAHDDNYVVMLSLGDNVWGPGTCATLGLQGTLHKYKTGMSPVPTSTNVYATRPSLDIDLTNPLSNTEALQYYDLVSECSWESNDHAVFVAGWAVIAPFCGALKYRPCMWLTGESGSGKTWILDNLITPAMGKMLQRKTIRSTEAGTRRDMDMDALPIWLNEAESKTQSQADRMANFLELMRASSDPDSEIVMAGGLGGGVIKWKPRSMFLFTSILTSLSETADINRTVEVKLTKRGDEQWFQQFRRKVVGLIKPGFANRLIARTLRLMPVIQDNIIVLTEALAEELADRRIADTLAPMLAGYASLRSDTRMTDVQAKIIVKSRTWLSRMASEIKDASSPDHVRVYDYLMQQLIRMDNGANRSIGELIRLTSEGGMVEETNTLRRHGIKVEGTDILIAKAHEQLNRIYRGSEFAGTKWHQAMLQHPSASAGAQRMFESGMGQKYTVVIPISAVLVV